MWAQSTHGDQEGHRIRCKGRPDRGNCISPPFKAERVSTLIRRSEHIRGMKRKD
jgi:hypothetical protein